MPRGRRAVSGILEVDLTGDNVWLPALVVSKDSLPLDVVSTIGQQECESCRGHCDCIFVRSFDDGMYSKYNLWEGYYVYGKQQHPPMDPERKAMFRSKINRARTLANEYLQTRETFVWPSAEQFKKSLDEEQVKERRYALEHGLEVREPLVDEEPEELANTMGEVVRLRAGYYKMVYNHLDMAALKSVEGVEIKNHKLEFEYRRLCRMELENKFIALHLSFCEELMEKMKKTFGSNVVEDEDEDPPERALETQASKRRSKGKQPATSTTTITTAAAGQLPTPASSHAPSQGASPRPSWNLDTIQGIANAVADMEQRNKELEELLRQKNRAEIEAENERLSELMSVAYGLIAKEPLFFCPTDEPIAMEEV